jgi:HD superfamily phosphohydrolase
MLKINWLIDDPELVPFFEGVNTFCKEYLGEAPNTDYADVNRLQVFSDPIEAYPVLTWWEVALIDTALFQRLRNVRQLGLAHLVYPTLGYSRFEHTIGMLARLKQVLSSINDNCKIHFDEAGALLNPDQLAAVRLAVLAYNLGHCAFGHISTHAMENLLGDTDYPSTKYITNGFRRLSGSNTKIFRAIAATIVSCPAFVEFLEKLHIPEATTPSQIRILARNSAYLILGLPLPRQPETLYLAQLMNSALDVSKLDYVPREAHLSGINVGLSLGWLSANLYVTRLPETHTPTGLRKRIQHFPANSLFSVLSLNTGGQFALEEFFLARLALHEKIAMHPKIRACGAYAEDCLSRLPNANPKFKRVHQWLYLKEAITEFPNMNILSEQGVGGNNESWGPTGKDIGLDRISRRDLPSRAYAFGFQNSIVEPVTMGKDITTGEATPIQRFIQAIRSDALPFRDAIKNELSKIQTMLPHVELESLEDAPILIETPLAPNIMNGTDTVHIPLPSRLSFQWHMPVEEILEHYSEKRALGYVFSQRQYLPYVMLAAERAAWDMYKVICVQDNFLSKHVDERASEIKELHKSGYYNNVRELQPVSEYLASIDAQAMVTAIATKLGTYYSRAEQRVTPASVTNYIGQFPHDLQDVALKWLQHVEYIELGDLGAFTFQAFNQLLAQPLFVDAKKVALCPLGSTVDSASRMGYDLRNILIKDLASVFPDKSIDVLPLVQALGEKHDGYILFDDNINSGLQAINIMSKYLDAPLPKERQLNEDHAHELSSELKDEIMKKPLGFAYTVAVHDACERLKKSLVVDLGFDPERIACVEGKRLTKDHRIFSGKLSPFVHERRKELKDFLAKVAVSILEQENNTTQRAEQLALGYHNSEGMTVFSYNCPTSTVTALWIAGQYGGQSWEPLVKRSRRSS